MLSDLCQVEFVEPVVINNQYIHNVSGQGSLVLLLSGILSVIELIFLLFFLLSLSLFLSVSLSLSVV